MYNGLTNLPLDGSVVAKLEGSDIVIRNETGWEVYRMANNIVAILDHLPSLVRRAHYSGAADKARSILAELNMHK